MTRVSCRGFAVPGAGRLHPKRSLDIESMEVPATDCALVVPDRSP
ncbi:MAG: hypothetical protein MNPFHGCM_00184 [Gemmatimonadaceae bacterium]|nr:hypothetical protein [Gemmatimonadaceae bacterium]